MRTVREPPPFLADLFFFANLKNGPCTVPLIKGQRAIQALHQLFLTQMATYTAQQQEAKRAAAAVGPQEVASSSATTASELAEMKKTMRGEQHTESRKRALATLEKAKAKRAVVLGRNDSVE